MKRLTTEEMYFLMSKNEVVSSDLMQRWKVRRPPNSNDDFKLDRDHKLFALTLQLVATGLLLMVQFLLTPQDVFSAIFHAGAIAFVGWTVINDTSHRESDLTRQLNDLQDTFQTFGRKEIRDMNYFLNQSWEWLTLQTECILLTLANRLKDAEESDGPDSALAHKFRKEFKSCHAVFVPFGLCDEDQGKWLGRKVHISTPQPERLGMMA